MMSDHTRSIPAPVPDGVNPTVHYLMERAGWMIWPLAWVLIGAIAHHLSHHLG